MTACRSISGVATARPAKPAWSAPRRVWVAYLQTWGAWLPRYRRRTRDQIAREFYDRKDGAR